MSRIASRGFGNRRLRLLDVNLIGRDQSDRSSPKSSGSMSCRYLGRGLRASRSELGRGYDILYRAGFASHETYFFQQCDANSEVECSRASVGAMAQQVAREPITTLPATQRPTVSGVNRLNGASMVIALDPW